MLLFHLGQARLNAATQSVYFPIVNFPGSVEEHYMLGFPVITYWRTDSKHFLDVFFNLLDVACQFLMP
jgi:hypothetical protein